MSVAVLDLMKRMTGCPKHEATLWQGAFLSFLTSKGR